MDIEEARALHETAINQYRQSIDQIADMLLASVRDDLELRGDLTILFGMGSEAITYCGSMLWLDMDPRNISLQWNEGAVTMPSWAIDEDGEYELVIDHLQPLAEALVVAIEVVNGYSDGCPNNIDWKV